MFLGAVLTFRELPLGTCPSPKTDVCDRLRRKIRTAGLALRLLRGEQGLVLEHTQQRLPQVLKPQTEYATFAYVEDAQRLPIFLIQEGRPRSWSYRKQGLHGPEMGARRWGKRA